jgi:hypothetical protein
MPGESYGYTNENPDDKLIREPGPANDPDRVRKAGQFGELLTVLPKWAAYAVIAWHSGRSPADLRMPPPYLIWRKN